MATVPSPPGQIKFTNIGNTTVTVDSNGVADGGSPVLQWQVAFGLSPNVPSNFEDLNPSTGTKNMTGLGAGLRYYFWSRMRNAIGWSDYSIRNYVDMHDVPDPTAIPTLSLMTQKSIRAIITPNDDNGGALTHYRLGYSLNPSSITNVVTQAAPNRTFDLTNLDPGKQYYFWGKAVNTYGDSAWSTKIAATLIAGAYVKDGLVWKRAVPYVRDGGVWKLARPWGKSAGFWVESLD